MEEERYGGEGFGDPGTREALPILPLFPGNIILHTCVSRGSGPLATSPLGNSSREGSEPLMGLCVLTWARSPGRIFPGLPTPGPPGRPRLLVWLSRLWYSMGDCNAGAKRRTEGGLQQRQVHSLRVLLSLSSHFALPPKVSSM